MGELALRGLTVGYGGTPVIRDFDLRVADGEVVSLLGPSGTGKTTLLRAVAGLTRPMAGEIFIDGRSVHDLPPERRDAVMVFQKPLLFPYMNVAQNVGFGLKMLGIPTGEAQKRIDRMLGLVQLKALADRKVHALSGGQQQRVSLARALVLDPAVLLLDEPLSSLDANLRQQMRELIQEVQAETGVTTLFVTHDQSEALMLSHRVALILDGRVRQVGTPRELFDRPADPEVAHFFGGCNFFTGRVTAGWFRSDFGDFPISRPNGNGAALTATIRPEDVELLEADQTEGRPAVVRRTHFEGAATRVWVQCGETRFAALTRRADFSPGREVRLKLPPDKVRIFFPDATQETEGDHG